MTFIDIYALGMLTNVGVAVLVFFVVIISLIMVKEKHPDKYIEITKGLEEIKETRTKLIELGVSRFRISLITSKAWILMLIPFSAILDQAIMLFNLRTKNFYEIIIDSQNKQIEKLNQLAADYKNKDSK